MGWTPGPLAVEESPFSETQGYLTEVVVPGATGMQPGTAIASCHHNWREASAGERRVSWKEAQDNARLFSAAPELATVASLFEIRGPDDDGSLWLILNGDKHALLNLGPLPDGHAHGMLMELEARRRAAVAKARGGS